MAGVVTPESFGVAPEGHDVQLFTLLAGNGACARVMGYGATLVSLELPDPSGTRSHVALGFPALAPYLGPHPAVGATIGRYANRIAHARFELDGRRYALAANEPPHHLHGGVLGFGRRCFAGEADGGDAGVTFRYTSPDGEEGYPGTLQVSVRYSLYGRGPVTELGIEFRARTSAPTVVSLTHHGYFNLRDAGASEVLDHVVTVPAQQAYELDALGIPTGQVCDVAGSALDLRSGRALRERISELGARGGYDHCYALESRGREPVLAASVLEPSSGRTLEVFTTQPALQLFTGQALDGSHTGHGGIRYGRYAGLCLETQHPSDAPNQPSFPSTRLDPEREYLERVLYRFGA